MTSAAGIIAIRAMDGLHLRATAIAENIANANSPGFRLRSVDFEGALRNAVAAGPEALAAFRPTLGSAPVSLAGDEIRLDLEMAAASSTAGRYAALSDILNRQMQISRLAIRGGQ